jgi:hypothetical protein
MEVQVIVPTKELQRIKREIHRLTPIVSSSAKVSIFAFANRHARELKKEYRYGDKGGIPLAKSTLAKRRLGKRGTSKRRAIPAYGGSNPLWRTGALANSIEVLTSASGSFIRTKVRINPRTILPGGGIAWQVAQVQEAGKTFSVSLPAWSYAYFITLMTGTAGTSASAPKNLPETKVVKVTIPPRPVWTPVAERMLGRMMPELVIPFNSSVKQRSKLKINFSS